MSSCVPLVAEAGPCDEQSCEARAYGFELDTYVGASGTNAIYSSRASADVGVAVHGRYGILIGGGEYQFGDSHGNSSHYVGGLAGVELPLRERARLYAVAAGGYHHVDKGFTYDLDFKGTQVSGDTEFNSPYAGGQLRFQYDFGAARGFVMNVIAHARFDLDRDTATVEEMECTLFFCSTPATTMYRVGGSAYGLALGLGYAF